MLANERRKLVLRGDLTFQEAEESDLDTILDIYNFYILTTTATFYHNQISKEELRGIVFIGHEKYQTYLIHCRSEMVGFCFLTQFRKKEAYDRTAEIGVYLKPEFTDKGMGSSVVTFLEDIARTKKIRVLLASISGENTPSMKLFQRMGYEKCAHYRKVGEKFGRFLDVVDYQKILGN